jgi:hypothetical protein
MGATVGAIANAFFDATGARVREYPMTPDRVRVALKNVTALRFGAQGLAADSNLSLPTFEPVSVRDWEFCQEKV